ncbi:MAG: DUF1674 domain-containing protein [Alphaproteobacteria bacterium]|nr:DUF1674 domain-containing protein [Alphaproteobacteria bacterium]
MNKDRLQESDPPQSEPLGRTLTPAAERALAEAAGRRAKADAEAAKPVEEGGPTGAEPTRYGDWERRGLAVDF